MGKPIQRQLRFWGNNLGVRLPADVVREARLRVDQTVQLTVEKGKIIIEPIADDELTLEERLERFDPQRHAGEAMSVREDLGAERW